MSETTVSAVITWADKEVALKAYLGISGTAEDTNLQLWLEASAEMADQYLERTFTYTAPEVPADAVPKNVEIGCYEFCKFIRERNLINTATTMVKTDRLQENYAAPTGAGAMAATFAGALSQARIYWDPWKERPTLASGF